MSVTIDEARVVYAWLKGSFENSGYKVFLGGSTLVYGNGEDIDLLFYRKAERALTPEKVYERLVSMGFKADLVESTEHEWGFFGTLRGYLIDIVLVGWTGKEKFEPKEGR